MVKRLNELHTEWEVEVDVDVDRLSGFVSRSRFNSLLEASRGKRGRNLSDSQSTEPPSLPKRYIRGIGVGNGVEEFHNT